MRRFLYAMLAAIIISGLAPPARADLLTDLKAHWKLNEASGTRVDSEGSNDLTDNNTVTQATGKIGDAADFEDANEESLSIADNADLSAGDIDFTIAGWFYLDDKTRSLRMVNKWLGAGSQREYVVGYTPSATDRLFFQVSSDGSDFPSIKADSFGAVSTGVWIFIVAWHDATANTINIQVNNGTVDSSAHTAGVFNGTSAFRLGGVPEESGQFLDGRIDSVSFWKRVLTSTERTNLYNGGSGFDHPFTSEAAVRSFGVIIYNIPAGFPTGFPLGGLW